MTRLPGKPWSQGGGSGWVVSRCVNISPCYMFITPWVRKWDRVGISTIQLCVSRHQGNMKWLHVQYKYEAATLKVWGGDKGRNHWAPQALSSVSAQFWNAESHVYKHLFLICSIPLTPCLILSPSLPLFRPPCLPLCAGADFWLWLGQNQV